jgi:hypothetical protein
MRSTRIPSLVFALVVVCCLIPARGSGQSPSVNTANPVDSVHPSIAPVGLLIVAHGASPAWNARVRELVAQVEWADGPSAIAFLMGEEARTAGWDHGVDSLLARGARALVVVPLMVSSHGGHFRQLQAFASGAADSSGHAHAMRHHPPPVPTRVVGALDTAPELGLALAANWAALAARDRARPVVLVAHGPSTEAEAERWVANLGATAGRAFRERGHTGALEIGLLKDDAAPPVRAAAIAALRATIERLARASGDSVLVLPALISSGAIDQVKIPRDLEGLPVRYVPAVLAPRPELARWIERTAAAGAPVP